MNTALTVLFATICILTGCEKPSQTSTTVNSSALPESVSETGTADITGPVNEESTNGPMWYEAINWEKFPEKPDMDLLFTNYKIKAPLTMEKLAEYTDNCTIAPTDPNAPSYEREYVPIDELCTSSLPVNECKLALTNNGKYDLKYLGDGKATFKNLTKEDSFYFSAPGSGLLMINTDQSYPDNPAADGHVTFAFYKWQMESILEKYGRPSHVVITKGCENSSADIYWKRNGYLFGCMVTNKPADDGGPEFTISDIYYYTANAWDYYTGSREFSEKYILLSFGEYAGIQKPAPNN